MLLGWAIANCSERSLDQLFREVVAEPLGMRDTRYRPNRRDVQRIAATERNGDQRLHKGLIWGEVHDGNAWSLRAVAGHAGLFGTAYDLGRFVQALLNPKRPCPDWLLKAGTGFCGHEDIIKRRLFA